MSATEGMEPEWKRFIHQNNLVGLKALVSNPGFNFQQRYLSPTGTQRTALGYAILTNVLWAVDLLLSADAKPDAPCVFFPEGSGMYSKRPIECCHAWSASDDFLACLLRYGASTEFVLDGMGMTFVERVDEFVWRCNDKRKAMILAAHARELCAYTAVWCANNAGGSWPDMAMLLQATVMRGDLCERPTSSKKLCK